MTDKLILEDRVCGDCNYFRTDFDGCFCRLKPMRVIPSMHVGYYEEDGSCFMGKILEEEAV
jgi:hypothetical protein